MWLFGNKVMKSVEILENDRLCGIDEKWHWYTGKWPDEHTNINIHTSMHTHIYIYSSYTQSLSLPLFIYLQSSLTHTHNFPHSNDSKRMISRFKSATQICRSNTVLHSFHPNTHRTVFVFLLALTARDSFHSEYNSYHYPLVRFSHWGDCDSALVQ